MKNDIQPKPDKGKRSKWWPLWLLFLLLSIAVTVGLSARFQVVFVPGIPLIFLSALGFCIIFFMRITDEERRLQYLADQEDERRTREYFLRRNEWINDYHSCHGEWPKGGWPRP